MSLRHAIFGQSAAPQREHDLLAEDLWNLIHFARSSKVMRLLSIRGNDQVDFGVSLAEVFFADTFGF